MCWRGRTKSFDRRASRGEGVRKMAFNPKSKIQNPKWLGLFSIVLTFVFGGATATAQQPTKIPRIGFLSGRQSPDDDRRGTGRIPATMPSVWACASLATWKGRTSSLSGEFGKGNKITSAQWRPS